MKSNSKKTFYGLDSKHESARLEAQNQNRNYDPSREIPKDCLKLKGGEKILDAGCGSAVLSKLVLGYYPQTSLEIDAVDNSQHQINNLKRDLPQIRAQFPLSKIECYDFDLQEIDKPKGHYDLILCRYVYQHIPQIMASVSEELCRLLRPGGRLILIDADGVFYGLETEDKFLNHCMTKIKENYHNFDAYVCKKVPRVLINAGLKIEGINHVLANFYSEADRKHEHEQWRSRFGQLRPYFEKILGVSDSEKFQQAYLKEILSPLNFFYCNKFTFFARKAAKA